MNTWIWCKSLRKEAHLEDPGIDGRIILEWIFKKWDRIWTDLSQERDQVAGAFECVNDLSGFIKFGSFFDWLKIC